MKKSIAQKVIRLPNQFYSIGNVSISSLLKETGYYEHYNSIDASDIRKAIESDIDCIDQWITWSENKRTSSGWYFKRVSEGKCIVGHYPNTNELMEYADAQEACATFIKLELEDIRTASL